MRNRVLAAWFLKLQSQIKEPEKRAREYEQDSEFSDSERFTWLRLVIDEDLAVIDIDSYNLMPCKLDVALKDLGYQHLYLCITRHLADDTVDPFDADALRNLPSQAMPRTTLKVYNALSIGQRGAKASYSPFLKSPPFQMAQRFIAAEQSDGTIWYGVTTLLLRVETIANVAHDLAYVKWAAAAYRLLG